MQQKVRFASGALQGHAFVTAPLSPHLNVATLQREAETGLLILDKVQCHLGIAFFLQVGNDGLAHKLRIPHHVQHLQRKGPSTEADATTCEEFFYILRPQSRKSAGFLMPPHLIILSVDQCQLEFEFCGINSEDSGAALSVQAVDVVPLYAGHVDRQVQGADNSVIPMPTHSTRVTHVPTQCICMTTSPT